MAAQRLLSKHATVLSVMIVGALSRAPARGDGGTVQLQQIDGPFRVTVFTSPTPLRAGAVDVNVLVQSRDNDEPILNAEVFVTLSVLRGGPTLNAVATRQQATNKLLYAALVDLPSAGAWDLHVTARRGRDAAVVSCQVIVAAALPPLLAHWPYLAFPPAVVFVFALHQWRRSRSNNAS